MINALSKSKLLAYRQCSKRLWLEVHHPELRADSDRAKSIFEAGHQVGEIARKLYDPDQRGVLIELDRTAVPHALAKTTEYLTSSQPIFEAGFSADGALAFADAMLPVGEDSNRTWRLIEVKSSTSVKDYHRDDVAVQAFVARRSGVALSSISLAHIDSKWVYPGGGDYQGLLTEQDLTDEAFARESEVSAWIDEAQGIVSKKTEPTDKIGRQCDEPYECGFKGYCGRHAVQPTYPVSWLPRIQAKALKAHLENEKITDLRDVPDELLNETQLRVKTHTLNASTYFDATGAAADLAAHPLPAYFLDFETISFAVPIWKGTRPYQHIPFQFSLHHMSAGGDLKHTSFLDLSGEDPSAGFAAALIKSCGEQGPVFAYSAGFEGARIKELAARLPQYERPLLALVERLVDLLKVASRRFYHPSQQGSWSIKKLLPVIAPELRYDALDGVQDGNMAMQVYVEAVNPSTSASRKTQIERELVEYCKLDTLALVRLWQFFTNDGKLP